MHTIQAARQALALPASNVLEVMVFKLGEQEYGIDLARVQELRSFDTVTPVPGAPAFICGTIDLLGTRVPLVDMRVALGTALPPSKDFIDIVIFTIGDRLMGAAVDVVVDVVTLTAAQIAPPPPAGAPLSADCQIGIGILGERRLILLDIDDFMRDVISTPARHAA